MRLIQVSSALVAFSLLGLAGTAAASPVARAGTRSAAADSADAGYTVTGKHLSVAETWVPLPHASRFATEAGRVGASVQLWTSREVIDLRVSACTDAGCRAGGRPAFRSYHAALEVFNRATHALICSTAVTGPRRCPAPIGRFSKADIAPGQTVALYLTYVVPYDFVFVGAGSYQYQYPVPSSSRGNPRLDFTQARIVTEFGASPWARPALRAPAARLSVMSFDRPVPPPYAAEIGNLAGKTGGVAAPYWRHHRISTRPGRANAAPGALWDDGYGLTVYLR